MAVSKKDGSFNDGRSFSFREQAFDLITLLLWCGIVSVVFAGVAKMGTFTSDRTQWISLAGGVLELLFVGFVFIVRVDHLRCGLVLAAFSAFAGVSAFHVLTRADSCGCLGVHVSISPTVMLSFDVVVAVAACAAFVKSFGGESAFLVGWDRIVGRVACSSLLVICLAGISVASGNARIKSREGDTLVALQSRAIDIRTAFAVGLDDGDWEVSVLRQSCGACQELVENPEAERPFLIAMLVEDVIEFYAKDEPSGNAMVSPLLTTPGSDQAILAPSSLRMERGQVVSVCSLVSRKGVVR